MASYSLWLRRGGEPVTAVDGEDLDTAKRKTMLAIGQVWEDVDGKPTAPTKHIVIERTANPKNLTVVPVDEVAEWHVNDSTDQLVTHEVTFR